MDMLLFFLLFLLLHVTVWMLIRVSADLHCDSAKAILRRFVSQCSQLHNKEMVVFIIIFHNLIHLADDMRNIGEGLDAISAFPFEDALQHLKKLLRSCVCQQW